MRTLLIPPLLLMSSALFAAETNETTLEAVTVTTASPNTRYDTPESSTASRILVKKSQTPYSVGTINQALLQDSQCKRLEDCAFFISGVQPDSNQSGLDAAVMIRGFSTAGATYLNGMLDNPRFQVHDIAILEQHDILKGSSSVLYGASSPGGIVNYVTKKPQAKSQNTVQFSVGNYDSYRIVADSTGKVADNENLLYRVIGAGQIANTFRPNVPQDKVTFAPSLSWQYAKQGKLDLELEYEYENRPYQFDNVYSQGEVVYDRAYVDPRAKSERHHWRVSSQLSQELVKNWNLILSSQFFHTERHDLLIGDYTFASPTTLSGYYRDIHDHYNQLSLRGEIHGKFDLLGTKHELVLGTERNYTQDYLNSQRKINGFKLDIYQPQFNYPLPTKTTPLNNNVTSVEYGQYLHDHITIADVIHIFSGFRYSEFKAYGIQNNATVQQPLQSAVVYNAGLSFTPSSDFSAYYGYNQSFQPNSGITRFGKPLAAKHGELHEIGIKTAFFDKKMHLSTALYQLKQYNLPRIDPIDRDYQITLGEIISHGLEIEMSGQLTEQWQVLANYSWIDAKDKVQRTMLRSTPKHSGALWSNYQFPWNPFWANGKLKVGGGLIFVDKRFGDDANSFQVAGYIRPDFFIAYQLPPVDFRLNIENVFDKRYVSTSVADDTVVQGNRRFIQASMAVNF